MARHRRNVSAFSLSFLDIMSCGFGAVVLLFLIIKHNIDVKVSLPIPTTQLTSEVKLLEEEIVEGKKNLARARNTLAEVDEELAEARGLAARIMEEKKHTSALTEDLTRKADSVDLESLKTRIQALEQRKQEIQQEIQKTGEDVRKIKGEGKQQYITGLKVQGNHLLVLLDMSASMLDDTIVNVIRFRNMRDEVKRNARKWRRAIKAVEWLTARFPVDSQFQIYVFNTDTKSVLPDTTGKWLDVRDSIKLNKAVDALGGLVPEDGTNLDQAFAASNRLTPRPDSIFLITDGLPTQGPGAPRGLTISGRDRLNLFSRSIKKLPSNVPINVILIPMEGDPEAAPAFWGLARATDGSFMSPSSDWP